LVTLRVEVHTPSETGAVQYEEWELPLRTRSKRRGVVETHTRELRTPLGLVFAVAAECWPGTGRGSLSVTLAGESEPLADVYPLVEGSALVLKLPTGERLSIVARTGGA
jgi:hypothetical protein